MNDPAMSFSEIGARIGLTAEGASIVYYKGLKKLRMHMKTHDEWESMIESGQDTTRVAIFIQAAIKHGAMVEKGCAVPRHKQTTDTRAFKMAYRAFLRGEK